MAKKEENMETCSCNCKSWGRVLGVSLSALWLIISIITCLLACGALLSAQKSYEVSKASYDFNILSAGWQEGFDKMNEIYASDAYVKYATENTNQMQEYLNQYYGSDATDSTEGNIVDAQNSSLDNLISIAVSLWTDWSALQACVDEWRYVQAVNDMMNQASELFGVSGTPGNVIVDRENGNYILIAGAYPAEEFVNAINEYKNGAENYIAGGDEVKNVVNNMLASTPVRGDENARFTIVEYTELLCPYCQRHSQQWTINTVLDQFPGEVNSVSRHFIIHWEEALQLEATMECVAELNPSAYYEVFEEAFQWL